ncbi:MAG: RHS repeat-associated core domain-containing protein, partial [Acidimicrobiales bacterium]
VHRYYDPSTEQFVSVDPLVSKTQTPYSYAGGDPVNGTDPSGDGDCPAAYAALGCVVWIQTAVSVGQADQIQQDLSDGLSLAGLAATCGIDGSTDPNAGNDQFWIDAVPTWILGGYGFGQAIHAANDGLSQANWSIAAGGPWTWALGFVNVNVYCTTAACIATAEGGGIALGPGGLNAPYDVPPGFPVPESLANLDALEPDLVTASLLQDSEQTSQIERMFGYSTSIG